MEIKGKLDLQKYYSSNKYYKRMFSSLKVSLPFTSAYSYTWNSPKSEADQSRVSRTPTSHASPAKPALSPLSSLLSDIYLSSLLSAMSSNNTEDIFRLKYAKAIAEALQANEEEERNKNGVKSSHDDATTFEKAKQAYSQLCHDDPRLHSDDHCRCLAKVLSPRPLGSRKEGSKLGLCTRLVDGLFQAVARAESQMTNQSNDQKTTTGSFGSTVSASREGYARLAFTIFVEAPYRCIQQADNLTAASTFLGSFEPPKAEAAQSNQLTNEEKARLVDEATKSIVDGMEKMAMQEEKSNPKTPQKCDDASSSSSEFFHHNKTNYSNLQNDDASIEEIFAEESDPDDFDFGPDLGPQTYFGMPAANLDDVGFDPMKLSEPSATNKSWDGTRNAIIYLMSNLSYGKMLFSSLSSRTWLDMSASETLADFAFMLLLHHTQKDNTASVKEGLLISPDQFEIDGSLDISALWDRPLFLLRDRALDLNHDHDALVSYLQLLQAFLSHSENDIMSILSSPSSKQQLLLPPITSVGLSGLATLCASKELTCTSASKMSNSSILSICAREEVKKTILKSLYSLAHVLECVRPRKMDRSDDKIENERLWIRTAACVFPIIEYVTNLRARFDYQPVFDGSCGKQFAFTEADAKVILDSGVFRELIAMSAAAAKHSIQSTEGWSTSDAAKVTRAQLLQTICALCLSSPDLIGKYAVRVPDLFKEVQSAQFMKDNCVDGVLWTSLSSSLLESKSDTSSPRLRLRAGVKLNTSSAPIDDTSMAERSCFGFLSLCSSAHDAIGVLQENASSDMSWEREELEKHKKTLVDLVCFANCLANCSNATNAWVVTVNCKQDMLQQAKGKVIELRSLLASIPSYSDDIKTQHKGHKKNDDDEETEQEYYDQDASKAERGGFNTKAKRIW